MSLKKMALALLAVLVLFVAWRVTVQPSEYSSSSVLPGGSAFAQTGAPPLGETPPTTTSPSTSIPQNNPPLQEELPNQEPGTYETCVEENGRLAFMACPILDSIANMMSEFVSTIMRQFLRVEPLQFEGPIYDTWNGVRVLANIAFVLIFVVIIASYLIPINLSAYSVKSIMPKLVAAAIFVQASYLISAIIVDIGNILGEGIGAIITSVANGGSAAPAGFSVDVLIENMTTIFGIATLGVLLILAWPMAAPFALIVVISIAAFVFTLAIRYFLIGLFIVVSPLAFAAWVLPNTEKYFHQWFSSFIKISLMYPIIIGMLAIAANVGGLIPLSADSGGAGGSASQDVATSIIKILVLAAAFGAITQSFRWAGGFMSAAGAAIDDLGKKGRGKIKDSQMYEDAKNKTKSRQLKRVDKIGDKLSGLTSSDKKSVKTAGKGMYHAGTLVLAGHSGTSLAKQRDSSRLVKKYADQLDDMKEANMPNQNNALMAYYGTGPQQESAKEALLRSGGESLLSYTKTSEGRQALVRRLADNNLLMAETSNAIQGFGHPSDYQMMLAENGKNTPKAPDMLARYDRDDPGTINPLTGESVIMGDVNAKRAKGALSSLTPRKIASDDFNVNMFKRAADYSTPIASRIAKQWAQVLGEAIPHSVVDNFDPDDRQNFAGADKRAALLTAMARSKDEFTSTVEGQRKFDELREMVLDHVDMHRDAIHIMKSEDDWDEIRVSLNFPPGL